MPIYDLHIAATNGTRVRLNTTRAYNITVKNSRHGFGSLEFSIDLNPAEITLFYANPQVLNVKLWYAGYTFNGRLEDTQLNANTMRFTALGYWSALSDVPYTAFWSKANVQGFDPIWTIVGSAPQKYEYSVDTNDNKLYIAPKKNENFANTSDFMQVSWGIPNGSTRQIIGVSCTVEVLLPVNWRFRINTYNSIF